MYKIIGANQTEYGPVSADQLRQWIIEGRVNAQTLAQAEGETSWKPISQFPEFATSFATSTAPSAFDAGVPLQADPASALKQVSGPAIGLIVLGALVLIGAMLALVVTLAGGNAATTSTGNPQIDRLLMGSNTTLSLVQQLFMLAVGGIIIFGGIKMKRLESYGLCMTASILGMIPCFTSCCCLIGLPVGIWALVVMNKPEVKSFFKK